MNFRTSIKTFLLIIGTSILFTACGAVSESKTGSTEKSAAQPAANENVNRAQTAATKSVSQQADESDNELADNNSDSDTDADEGDAIVINSSKVRNGEYQCRNSSVVVNGNDIEAAIRGNCRAVTINGNNSKLDIESFATIALNGNGNRVTYQKTASGQKPRVISQIGSNNKLSRAGGSANDADTAENSVVTSDDDGDNTVTAAENGDRAVIKNSRNGKNEVRANSRNGEKAVINGGSNPRVETRDANGRKVTITKNGINIQN